MDTKKLQELDALLAREEQHIQDEFARIAEKDPSVKGGMRPAMPEYGNEEDDNVQEVVDFDRNFAFEKELEGRLRGIQKVRASIQAGTYGSCENCGTAISQARLKAVPTARLCISCAGHESD